MNIFSRYKQFYKEYGLSKTVKKILSKPSRFINKKKAYKNLITSKKKIFNHNSLKDRFSYIYTSNFWPSKESVSGPGSELENTVNIRKEIGKLIIKYKFKKILDAPCGDFNWIRHIISNDINYIGGDIVPALILKNKKKYSSSNIEFIELDIINDKLPNVDLLICRDCLIHLSTANIERFFNNLKKSTLNYFLLTSYELKTDDDKMMLNVDIRDGDYRPLFLTKPPFNLPSPIIKFLDKDLEHKNNSNLKCYLYLYSRKELK
jgi:SAM-dependent methyltransferase